MGVVILVFGLLFFFRKILKYFHFWKKMSPSERSKVNTKPLCRNVGSVISLAGVILIVAGLWEFFLSEIFLWAMIAWVVIVVFDFSYLMKNKSLQGEAQNNGK